MMYMKHKSCYLVVLIIAINVGYCQKSKLNKACRIQNTRAKGTCLLPTNCPRAVAEADRGIPPTICGNYTKTISIVCCQGAHPVFNIPLPPNELVIPDEYPEIEETPFESPPESQIDEGAAGYKASQRCRDYLNIKQNIASGLTFHDKLIIINETVCAVNGVGLIVGGEEADPREFPFMAAIGWPIGNEIVYNCGGTLISPQFVITAAHCTHIRAVGPPSVIRLGAGSLKKEDQILDRNAQNYNISDIIKHKQYDGYTHYHDIAIMKLLTRITRWTDFIRPICMWTKSNFDSSNAVATGWGNVEEAGDPSEILLKVPLELYSNLQCAPRYKYIPKLPQGISDSMICSGYLPGGRDTCQGDSGGPLVTKQINGSCEYYLIGITSFGKGCGKMNIPGLYTKVSSYLGWIEDIVWS